MSLVTASAAGGVRSMLKNCSRGPKFAIPPPSASRTASRRSLTHLLHSLAAWSFQSVRNPGASNRVSAMCASLFGRTAPSASISRSGAVSGMLVMGVVRRNSASGRLRNSRRRDSASSKIFENSAGVPSAGTTACTNASMRRSYSRRQSASGSAQFDRNSCSGRPGTIAAGTALTASTNTAAKPDGFESAASSGTKCMREARRGENTGLVKSIINNAAASRSDRMPRAISVSSTSTSSNAGSGTDKDEVGIARESVLAVADSDGELCETRLVHTGLHDQRRDVGVQPDRPEQRIHVDQKRRRQPHISTRSHRRR